MIKAVLFDYGGVLSAGGGRGSVASIVGQLYGVQNVTQDDIQEPHDALRKGEITSQQFFDGFNERFGTNVTVTEEQFFERGNMLARNEKVYELAADLRSHGIQTGILSNVYEMTAKRLADAGCYEGFDPLILSYEEGLEKPEREFYAVALSKLGLQPEEVLFVDDQEKCIPPAKALGLHTILSNDEVEIVQQVKATLLAENGLEL